MENTNIWSIEGSSKARLVSATPNIEEVIAYIARVTSKNQENPNIVNLLRYCQREGHVSVFEHGHLTVEVVTPLAISIQVLRHRSFKFQQFSGRYENQELMRKHTSGLNTYMEMFYIPEIAREQDSKNRQKSIPTESEFLTASMKREMENAYKASIEAYTNLIDMGVAKEVARFVLPQGVYTRLYVTGDVRSFVHYLMVRDEEGVVQHEHCELARAIKSVIKDVLPLTYEAYFHTETLEK